VVVVVVCDVGGCTGVVTVVWRVVVVVASGSLAQDTSIKRKTESAEPSMIALFISIYCLFNKQFVANPIASRIKAKNSS
jgi:hypothetical protein